MKEGIDRIIEEQERKLRFSSFSFDVVERVCSKVVQSVLQKGATGFVLARVNGLTVYARCLSGGSLNNEEWARRKANLCERYGISSYHVVRKLERDGKTLASCGMNDEDYGFSAGSFPILLASGVCIGSITFSGMSGEEDHQVVAGQIAAELDVDIPSVI